MYPLLAYKKIHFIGVGGAGMSAVAKLARYNNITVTGSDLSESELTKDLQEKYDVEIYIGVNPDNVTQEHDLVIYSPAIPESNSEMQEARNYGISCKSYPEVLGMVTENYTTIAVAGTNGKTTTTSMVIELLKHLGADPSGIVGALLQKYHSNFIAGHSEYFVTEACEYKESFLNIHHDVLVITNITPDHLDYFTDLVHIQETFKKFLHNKKDIGILICDYSLPALKPIIKTAEQIGMTIIDYSKYLNNNLKLSIPGKHNLQNAAAALAVVESLNLSLPDSYEYLKKYFQGTKRRMEHIGMTENGIQLFDDYAHNPEGLDYLIQGLRDFYPEKKIIMLFEPHLYSRTRDFKHEFARSLEAVDILYLFPTYRAREPENPHENYLLEQYIDISKVELITISEPDKFTDTFKSMQFSSDYIVISAGAGDIWKHSHSLKNN